ncbi:MAG: NAD(+)/NADH kinase [Actinomycetota bacterium]|nr:NAD(+)/NADH kinase [Actinomycetota bacterium]
MRAATVFTHRRVEEVAAALAALRAAARDEGVELRFDEGETAKHAIVPAQHVVADAEVVNDVDLCVVLGGDGTILRALRRYAGTGVPVFAVNFGEVGFLATIEPDELGEDGFHRAFRRDFEVLSLPALSVEAGGGIHVAVNDVSIHRKVGGRVANLAYALDGAEVGRVRCDGLVVATPAGSTGYNLANGGPVLAWGVEGFVVSFIAPHSLAARALVVAPDDPLTVDNRSREAVDVSVDGLVAGELGPGEALTTRFLRDAGALAQEPGSSFYKRLRDKFGKLAA